MKLLQLQYFRAVCLYGSVTQAAQQLHITQPSVSSSIKELENEFGVNLFYRQNRRLVLTEEGRYFLTKAEDLLERAGLLEKQMKEYGERGGNVTIGIPPMISTFLFPDMFQEFSLRCPDVQLELQELGTFQAQEAVNSDAADLAIVILTPQTEQGLHILPLCQTQMMYCVEKHDPLAREPFVTFEMLRDQKLVVMRSGFYQNELILGKFKALGIRPNVLLYSNQLYVIKEFVRQHYAGAFLYEEIVKLEDDWVGVPFRPALPISIGLVWKKNKHIYSDTARFIDFAREYAEERKMT